MANLYQKIIEHLNDEINKGNFTYGKPFCTEKQLMEKFGVSNITAKRAITELEHQGVLYRKRGVGSFVARPASSIPSRPTDTSAKIYAILLPFNISTDSDFMMMVQLINSSINPRNGYLSLYTTDRDIRREKSVLAKLTEQNIAGLVYSPNTNDIHLDVLKKFALKNIPVVILDKTVTAPFLHNVVCDNFTGARLMTDHLISLGHTKIAYISSSGISKLTSVAERLSGYIYSMNLAGLPISPDCVVTRLVDSIEEDRSAPSQSQIDRIKEKIALFLSEGVTAIECENDGLAECVRRCCSEMSLRVPEDISISGYDGCSPARSQSNPPFFTSVYQDLELVGKEVARILLSTMDNCMPLGEKVVIPVTIQLGSSCGKPPIKQRSPILR